MAQIATYACIDIGTASVRMVIAEVSAQGTRLLDRTYRNIAVGRDTYTVGSIQSETVEEICQCLQNYRCLLREYDVRQCRVVATSALRDAKNRDYVVDRIRVRASFDVQVMGPSEEHFIWLKSLATTFPNYMRMRERGCMVANIGLGTVQISVIEGGVMRFSRQLPMGALKFWETMAEAGRGRASRSEMMEGYMAAQARHIMGAGDWKSLRHCVFLCNEAELLQDLFNMKEKVISEASLDTLCAAYRDYPPEQLAADRNITLTQAQFVLPMLLLMQFFFGMTDAKRLHMPVATLPDGMIVHMAERNLKGRQLFPFDDDILSVCRGLAESYHSDMSHVGHVEESALRIFDDTAGLHGLQGRDRLLLRIAALLHMSGSFIATENGGELSAQLVRASRILGLTDLESRICAVIVQHVDYDMPRLDQLEMLGLRERRRVRAAKLLAILQLADALDFSWKQNIRNLRVAPSGDDYEIFAEALGDSHLEEWMLRKRMPFFQEVYGVRIDLKIKRLWI